MEQRLRTVTIEIGTFILLCGIDLLVFSITGHGIPCAFRLLTGYLCPGCGITHACIAILHGDLQGAFRDNALSVTLLPVLLFYFAVKLVGYIRIGRLDLSIVEDIFLLLCFLICVLYAILRNVNL
jgi:hypothetical protein